jgi:hypothetical protein
MRHALWPGLGFDIVSDLARLMLGPIKDELVQNPIGRALRNYAVLSAKRSISFRVGLSRHFQPYHLTGYTNYLYAFFVCPGIDG